MRGVAAFAHDVRHALAECLAAEVSFRGSFAHGGHDEYSDVDLDASVRVPLDGPFFTRLEAFLTGRYGPALVRYDPDFREVTTAQGVRFSFYRLPAFWRVDLTVRSDAAVGQKWPSPFPEWAAGTSALMNVLWAIKWDRRGNAAAADHYLGCACDKLGGPRLAYTALNALTLLGRLRGREDTDQLLAASVCQLVVDRICSDDGNISRPKLFSGKAGFLRVTKRAKK
jgi:hypothetical protein